MIGTEKEINCFEPLLVPQGGIRQIASVLNWYGALFVELARVAACAVPALQGNVIPLAANTASVIKPDGEDLSKCPKSLTIMTQETAVLH